MNYVRKNQIFTNVINWVFDHFGMFGNSLWFASVISILVPIGEKKSKYDFSSFNFDGYEIFGKAKEDENFLRWGCGFPGFGRWKVIYYREKSSFLVSHIINNEGEFMGGLLVGDILSFSSLSRSWSSRENIMMLISRALSLLFLLYIFLLHSYTNLMLKEY